MTRVSPSGSARKLERITRRLAEEVDRMEFGPPVSCVYNPLIYAREPHERYLERYARGPLEAVLVGMNPGPFGMAQTGVPFGDAVMAREVLGVAGEVRRPPVEHPRRPLQGFDCPRREVSGTRLWSWVRQRWGGADEFFDGFFVLNYCPLVFLEKSGRNRTPDRLPAAERKPLLEACDRALSAAILALEPRAAIGIGAWAERRIRAALPGFEGVVGRVLHPSPASPAANRGWARAAEKQLRELGIELP